MSDLRTYSLDQCAEILGCKKDHVRDLVARGELLAVNVSLSVGSKKPRLRIKHADLAAFIDARTTSAPAPRARRRKADAGVVQFYQ